MSAGNENSVTEWARPEDRVTERDKLVVRLDVYSESIIMHTFLDDQNTKVQMVSGEDIHAAFTRLARTSSGLLPPGTLWWSHSAYGPTTALWRPPRVWNVTMMTEALKPPLRFSLPMPGFVFLCTPGRPPWIFAAKEVPQHPSDDLYHAPTFNTFTNGSTCPGNHAYPQEAELIPESFFASFFSPAGNQQNRSLKHPDDLIALWEELDGQWEYPLEDLVYYGKVEAVIRNG